MPTKSLQKSLISLSVAAACFSVPQISVAESIAEAFSAGKASLNMRYRYESVDDSVLEEADANTLRSRLGFTTGDYKGFKAHADFEVVNTGGDYSLPTTDPK